MSREVSNHHRLLGINVKDHSRLPDGGNESQRELAYDATREQWWEDAAEHARELGFAGVYAAGRSGGWLQPYYATGPTGRAGRGVDLHNPRERLAFKRMRAWCTEEMQTISERFADNLADIIAETPEPIPAPPADECARFLAFCENRRDTAATSERREFWRRLAGSVRKAATMI